MKAIFKSSVSVLVIILLLTSCNNEESIEPDFETVKVQTQESIGGGGNPSGGGPI